MRRTALLVVAGVLSAALGVAGSSSHVLRGPELATVDARFDVRGERAPHPDVVVVGLDATSLTTLDVRPPIPRRLHAAVIDELRRKGARTIAYDFEFVGQTTVRDDNALFRALQRASGVILATSVVNPGPVTPYDGLAEETGAVIASVNFPAGATRGGTFRRMPRDELGLPVLAVAAAGGGAAPERFAGDGAWIDFAGPAGTYEPLAFSDVLAGQGDVRGKIVLVGPTDPIIQDVHPTASGEGMPGVEIHANAVATILDDFPLRDPPGWLALLLIAGLGLAVPLAAIPLRGLRWLPLPVLLGIGFPVTAQLAFDGGTVLPVAAPLVALLIGSLGTLAVAYATDLRDRRRLRASFARFVPPALVDAMAEHARLGGEELDATVLFCDLRGSTPVVERLSAPEVIAMLDRFLTAMSDAVLDHGGTVVSYLGDGLMAVFGAPLAQADHADRALAAAREMLGPRLAAFNADGGHELRLGVGLCSGPVMSGTVGSDRRLEYAAVGNPTVIASRLEALTKERGGGLLVAESTVDRMRERPRDLEPVGELEVRGRGERVAAWTIGE